MIKPISILIAGIGLSGWLTLAVASPVTLPNTFTSGTKAVAAQVNANFAAVKTAADDNNSRIAALEAKNTALEAKIAALESKMTTVNSSQVMALDQYLTVDTTSDPRGPLVQFHGANVQVVNGMASTETANGLGNLIIGYDEADASGAAHCTLGTDPNTSTAVIDANTCAIAGGSWLTTGFKTGSHYLVVGSQNNYSRWGGVVVGKQNTSNYDYASVLGGELNVASGLESIISGGRINVASGRYSSVSGGSINIASGDDSSVSGGGNSIASGNGSSVSGGDGNIASGQASSVSGGVTNTASGYGASSVSGGYGNTADGRTSSILGGNGQTTTANYQTIPALP